MSAGSYGRRPSYAELVAILCVGLGHLVIELGHSGVAATAYNVAVSLAFLVYLIWRIRSTPGALRAWGFRTDNLVPAALAQLQFVVPGMVALLVFAMVTGSPGLPGTFWLTVAIYPVWGIAQQFALQNLIANNITGLLSGRVAISVTAAFLFAASHFPRLELVALTFVAGIFFTYIYRKHPNLWVVGTAHGLLGSVAFYVVLRQDPGAVIIEFLTGRL